MLLAVLASCSKPKPAPSESAEDTPQSRRQAAERYLKVVPPQELIKDTAENVATNLPEAKRGPFVEAMTKQLDLQKLNQVMIDSMVNRFTVKEINALADFYGSPEGRSVMKKFGLFMADVTPAIEAETRKAIASVVEPPR